VPVRPLLRHHPAPAQPYCCWCCLFAWPRPWGVFDLIVVLTGGGLPAATRDVAGYAYLNAMPPFSSISATAPPLMDRQFGCCCLLLGALLLLVFAPSPCRGLSCPRRPFPCTDCFVKHPASCLWLRPSATTIASTAGAEPAPLGEKTPPPPLGGVAAGCLSFAPMSAALTPRCATPIALLGAGGDRSGLDPGQLRPDPQQDPPFLALTCSYSTLVGLGTTLTDPAGWAIPAPNCPAARGGPAAAAGGKWGPRWLCCARRLSPRVLLFLAAAGQLARQFGLATNLLALCLPLCRAFASPGGCCCGGGLCRLAPRARRERTAGGLWPLAAFCAGSWCPCFGPAVAKPPCCVSVQLE